MITDAEEQEAFRQQVADFFSGFPVHECLPEASKLLLLDNRIAITVAARALEQYHRPFGCVLNRETPALTNIFDGYELISFLIHVAKYYTDAGYIEQLHDSLLRSVNPGVGNSLLAADLTSALTDLQTSESTRDFVSREVEETLAQLPSSFALKELETPSSSAGVVYSEFLSGLSCSTPVSTMSLSSRVAEEDPVDLMDARDSEALRKRIELLFPPPWEYTLEKWHKLNGKESPFPHLSMRHSMLDALDLLLETEEPRVIAWDDSRGSPFSFITLTSALSHFVQNFCGASPVLSKYVLADLNLGIGPDSLIVVPESLSFSHVLQLLRNNRWSAVPLVKNSGAFLGLLSVSQICFLFLGAVHEGRQSKWSWTDPVGAIWDNLVSAGATHPASATHTYVNQASTTATVKTAPNSPQISRLPPGESHASMSGSQPRSQITSKLGGAFLAKLGDYAGRGVEVDPHKDREDSLFRSSGKERSVAADLPSSLVAPKSTDKLRASSDLRSPKPVAENCSDASNAATAVQALIRNITCSAAVTDDDLTLKQLITHMVLTDDRRVIFLDPESHRIRSYVTPGRLMKFLLPRSEIKQ
eukprot:Gregarina_sp_Poly_1__5962@NODE_313_length_9615_cov_112_161500_g268_i0_p2_GENE_NODE_313_length_9615_cov_112_161500_g268_i0NODE_313_length_9615_cov_112_161500_g268_i0_p2_ORF_typecomplete_len587_score93_76CBS/PF00571_28/5_6e03CBS/PF00571_28/0_00099CBS/PF00571_28/5_2e03_NODE_313_length_9615_cov_112_161500_g268_i01971957